MLLTLTKERWKTFLNNHLRLQKLKIVEETFKEAHVDFSFACNIISITDKHAYGTNTELRQC